MLLRDPTIIDLYGQRTLLMHGDTLCRDDVKYLKFRSKVRNRFVQMLFLRKSLAERREIAAQMRGKSQEHTRATEASIMDVTDAEIQRVMRKHRTTLLIHGHTHRPNFHHFSINGQEVCRIVLSDWDDERGGSFLSCEPGVKPQLVPVNS